MVTIDSLVMGTFKHVDFIEVIILIEEAIFFLSKVLLTNNSIKIKKNNQFEIYNTNEPINTIRR
jgi:hypothetical protein